MVFCILVFKEEEKKRSKKVKFIYIMLRLFLNVSLGKWGKIRYLKFEILKFLDKKRI